MSTKEEEDFNKALDHETRKLMAMTPEARDQHVISIIDWLIGEIEKIKKQKTPELQQIALAKLFDKLNRGALQIIPATTYMFKTEYQFEWIRILKSLPAKQE